MKNARYDKSIPYELFYHTFKYGVGRGAFSVYYGTPLNFHLRMMAERREMVREEIWDTLIK